MSNPLFDIDIKRDGDKVVIDYMNYVNEISRKINRELERLSAADFDLFAHKLGYVKVAPDEVVVKRATAEFALQSIEDDPRAHWLNPEDGAQDAWADLTVALNPNVMAEYFPDLERALEGRP